MEEAQGPGAVVRRKLAGSGANTDGPVERPVVRALRLAMARAADAVLDLPLSVLQVQQTRSAREDLSDTLWPDGLLLILDGPDAAVGAICADTAMVAAIIQQQTVGRVLASETEPRPFTDTDAALLAPVIDDVLTRAAGLSEVEADRACLTGFSFGARAEDVRSLVLALQADRFRRFDLTLDLANGAATGRLALILPEPVAAPKPALPPVSPGPNGAMLSVQADLMAVLCRLRLPYSELSGWQAGQVVALPGAHLGRTRIQTIAGGVIAQGRLGRIDGVRAVRLSEDATVQEAPPHDPAKFEPHDIVPDARDEPGSAAAEIDLSEIATPEHLPDTVAMMADDPSDGSDPALKAEETALEISRLAGLPPPADNDQVTPPPEDQR